VANPREALGLAPACSRQQSRVGRFLRSPGPWHRVRATWTSRLSCGPC